MAQRESRNVILDRSTLMRVVLFVLVFTQFACVAPVKDAAPHAEDGPAAVRGTWVTTTGNDALESPVKTAATMRRLKELGFNTVYVECWKNGYTEFPSQAAEAVTGVAMKVNGGGAQRDLLAEVVREAKKNDLRVVGWFEYGFMAAYKDTDNELRHKTDWLTCTKDGRYVGDQNPFVWMNPLHPGPQQFLLDIVLEAVATYDLDGIQLDDRIAMPVEMGYDDFTKKLYASEHHGALPPDDPRDPQWVRWRADKITDYADRFSKAVKAADPDCIVSVSPAPYPWSLQNYCCDWIKWQGQAWDEFIPQCYRTTYPAFAENWREQVEAADRDRDLIAGIRVVGDGPATPWEDVEKEMNLAVQLGGGYCIWFSRGALEVYPEQFRAFHDGGKSQGRTAN